MKKIAKRAVALLCVVMILSSMLGVSAASHSHDSSYWNEGRCKYCGEFLPIKERNLHSSPSYYRVGDGKTAYMRQRPYAASNENIGERVYKLDSGTKVAVTETIVNGFGNAWYHVWYDNGAELLEGYIVSDKLNYDSAISQPVSLWNTSIPSGTLHQGWGFRLRGVIKAPEGSTLTTVEAWVYNADDSRAIPILPGYKEPYHWESWTDPYTDFRNFDIERSGSKSIDSSIAFGRLSAGNYIYVVTVATTTSPCPWPIIKSYFTIK